MRWLTAATGWVAACTPPGTAEGPDPTGGISPGPETGDTAQPADTGVQTSFSQPTKLEVYCDPTTNALRFVCHVTVEPHQPVKITFGRADGTGVEREHTSDLLTSDEIGLHVMAPETEYQFTASAVQWPDEPVVAGAVTTTLVPEDLRTNLVVTGSATFPYVGANHPCSSLAVAVVFDTVTGELVWYQNLDPAGRFGLMNMVQFTEDHTVLGHTGPSVVEVDLDGRDLLRLDHGVDYTEQLHHDLFKRNGQYYLLYQEAGLPILDSFVVLDAGGSEIGRWISADHLVIPDDATGDWMHTNTLWVDPAGDVYLSTLSQNAVLKLNGDLASPDFGEVQWTLVGGTSAFAQDFAVDWSAVDGEDGFSAQHHAHLRYDGRLTLLDNRNGRALVLTVDELALTATVDESWPTIEASCGPQGTAADTPGGNAVVGCSGRTLHELDAASGLERWSSDAVCPDSPTGPLPFPVLLGRTARWYPLTGW